MVARITSGATPAGALYYNKDKIDRGEARFLAAVNTPMQVTDDELRQIAREYMEYGNSLISSFCTRTSNAGIYISCRCVWGSTAASWRTTSRRGGRARSSILWNDTTACALPPRVTRSRRTTRC